MIKIYRRWSNVVGKTGVRQHAWVDQINNPSPKTNLQSSISYANRRTARGRRTYVIIMNPMSLDQVLVGLPNQQLRIELRTLIQNIKSLIEQKKSNGIIRVSYAINCRCTIPCTCVLDEDSFIKLPWCPSEGILSAAFMLSTWRQLFSDDGAYISVLINCVQCRENFCCGGDNMTYRNPTNV